MCGPGGGVAAQAAEHGRHRASAATCLGAGRRRPRIRAMVARDARAEARAATSASMAAGSRAAPASGTATPAIGAKVAGGWVWGCCSAALDAGVRAGRSGRFVLPGPAPRPLSLTCPPWAGACEPPAARGARHGLGRFTPALAANMGGQEAARMVPCGTGRAIVAVALLPAALPGDGVCIWGRFERRERGKHERVGMWDGWAAARAAALGLARPGCCMQPSHATSCAPASRQPSQPPLEIL